MLMDRPRACQAADPARPSLIIGFTEKILYTARIHFQDTGVRSKREHYGYAITQSDIRQQK